jgi:hypothetical protein
MSAVKRLDTMRLVKTGPSLRERLERWIAGQHHKAVITRLRRFREQLERDMQPEPWTALEAPMVLLLSDVCDALSLNEDERATVLGQKGERALVDVLETRITPHPQTLINERQAKALAHVRQQGKITVSAYRQLCPGLSGETLRRDLADLVRRGLLTRNGAKRGTYYTPA